ncbi:MAG: hypothetical protein JO031_12380 [Ktedonobacteraceae bacterium]|nr:hypothetical protein [Ktedonobacteraceae bacterium]
MIVAPVPLWREFTNIFYRIARLLLHPSKRRRLRLYLVHDFLWRSFTS